MSMRIVAEWENDMNLVKAVRRGFLARHVDLTGRGLEFGPFTQPTVGPEDGAISYADRFTQAQLAEGLSLDKAALIPETHYLLTSNDLSSLPQETFDYIIANHVMEHIPDMLGWLGDVGRLLKPGGVLFLALPDADHCFDRLRPSTTVSRAVERRLAEGGLLSKDQQLESSIYYQDAASRPIILSERLERARVTAIYDEKAHLGFHAHVFRSAGVLEEFFLPLMQAGWITFDLVDFMPAKGCTGGELIVVLRRPNPSCPDKRTTGRIRQSAGRVRVPSGFTRLWPTLACEKFVRVADGELAATALDLGTPLHEVIAAVADGSAAYILSGNAVACGPDAVILWPEARAEGHDDLAAIEAFVLAHKPERVMCIGFDADFHRRESLIYGDPRSSLQALLIKAGYMRAADDLYDLDDYNALDKAPQFVASFRLRSPAQVERWTYEAVSAERGLHMDMLLEGGRRADAHIARYVLAAQYVGERSLVLDAACGMGYGIEIIRALANPRRILAVDVSDFACAIARDLHITHTADSVLCCDAAFLPDVADGVIDVIASFETIEHLRDPQQLLATFRRVLNPAGYLVASVPNRWVDETGNDPNPDHHHVFDWTSFELLLHRCGFEIVERYVQNCGGALKEPHRLRHFAAFDETNSGNQAEWCVVVACPIPECE